MSAVPPSSQLLAEGGEDEVVLDLGMRAGSPSPRPVPVSFPQARANVLWTSW